ncbi:uncharacterized protein LOC128219967 isoform X1 [Mya arenaria]|uniref:uncharacterized protein LOC128219967 isoform X1 n=1 Tax=Mya arenaria TaxID=6604 RepID=UPI0022E8D18C|nr:uncharacterized protein LOC128219967 isoform X1 [Mya arenaria]
MNPLKCVIVTILYYLGVICKDQGVFISQDKTTWNESSCTLAEPRVICRVDGSCIVENGLKFLENAEDQDNVFWIGFVKTWISYAYVGCGQLNDGANYSVSTLGECRRTTGCQTFGIQKSTVGLRCKCANKNAPWTRTCKEKCVEADQYPCGGTADTNIFSFYTVESVPPSDHSQNNTRNCLLFYYKYKNGNYYYWESCNLKTTPSLLCSNKYFSEHNQMAERHYSSNNRWAQAVEICVVGGRYPASIQSINNVNFTEQDQQSHWTGITKKESIISLSDMLDDSSYPPLTYAYVEQINQTFYVRFAKECYLRKSLCAGGPTSGVTSTNAVIITDIHPTQAPILNTSTTPTSHPVPEGTPASLDKEEGGSSTEIVIGVVIAVTLLAVVVLAVLIKRRYISRACFNNAATAKSSGQPSTGLTTPVDNQKRVEYVNTAYNEMHRNTRNNKAAMTYEKLNMTKGLDNYLSLQEIHADEHDYQNT